jgi:hypothetical protein
LYCDSQPKKRNNQRGVGRNAVDAVGGDNEKQQTQEQTEDKTVTAGQIRGLVAAELRDRNRGDIAASYSGDSPEDTLGDRYNKQNENVGFRVEVLPNTLDNLLIVTELSMI